MNPEDLQAQVTRSAAVERELREQVAGLKAEETRLRKIIEGDKEQWRRAVQAERVRAVAATARATAAEKERDEAKACARKWAANAVRAGQMTTAAESALAEARGALQEAETVLTGTLARGECHRNWVETALQPARDRTLALARAGEQAAPEGSGYEPGAALAIDRATGEEIDLYAETPEEPAPAQKSDGIPPIDHDFVPTAWSAVDACDKRVSDDPDGRPSRQCGRPRREHQNPEGGK